MHQYHRRYRPIDNETAVTFLHNGRHGMKKTTSLNGIRTWVFNIGDYYATTDIVHVIHTLMVQSLGSARLVVVSINGTENWTRRLTTADRSSRHSYHKNIAPETPPLGWWVWTLYKLSSVCKIWMLCLGVCMGSQKVGSAGTPPLRIDGIAYP